MDIKFECTIESGNDAFSENPHAEVISILTQVIRKLQSNHDCGRLYDSNGNRVGEFALDCEDDEGDPDITNEDDIHE
jgi:hypothetical protein